MLLVALIATLVILDAGPGTQTATDSGRAALRVVSVTPVTVRGQGFRAAERIRVATKSRTTADSRRAGVRATVAGRFVVRFAGVDPCNTVSISAVGNKGSRASVALSPGWRLHCAAP